MSIVDHEVARARVIHAITAMNAAGLNDSDTAEFEFAELQRVIAEVGQDPDPLSSLVALVQEAVRIAGTACFMVCDELGCTLLDLLGRIDDALGDATTPGDSS